MPTHTTGIIYRIYRTCISKLLVFTKHIQPVYRIYGTCISRVFEFPDLLYPCYFMVCFISTFRVFKKSSPNGKVTVYLGKRDFIDHLTHIDPIGK